MPLQKLSALIFLLICISFSSVVESSQFGLLPLLPCISSAVKNEAYENAATANTMCASLSTSSNSGEASSCIHRNRNSNTLAVVHESCEHQNMASYRTDTQGNDSGVKSIEITIPNLDSSGVPSSLSTEKRYTNLHTMKHIGKTIMTIYLGLLKEHEVLTKSLTSGIIGIIGDFVAQCFEYNVNMDRHSHGQNFNNAFFLDRVRLFGIFFESTFVSGPLMHYAYDYMEHLVPVHDGDEEEYNNYEGDLVKKNRSSISKWTAASFHVLADIFILGPIFVFTMMLFTSIIEGRIATFLSELVLDFGPALWASTLASFSFVPIQLLAFKCLPIKFRLIYMNLQDVVWNAVVSVMAHKSRK